MGPSLVDAHILDPTDQSDLDQNEPDTDLIALQENKICFCFFE
jgi:hypothetical protein